MRIAKLLQCTLMLLLVSPLTAYSLSSDRDQQINIEADQLDMDDTQHISIYQGNVEMRQGSLHIQADKIVLHFTPQNNLERLEIEGSPATLQQLTDQNEPISGSALHIIYSDNQLLLKLSGDAHFNSGKDSIDSEWITINTDTDAIRAGSIKGRNRVRMLINPKAPQPQNNNDKQSEQ